MVYAYINECQLSISILCLCAQHLACVVKMPTKCPFLNSYSPHKRYHIHCFALALSFSSTCVCIRHVFTHKPTAGMCFPEFMVSILLPISTSMFGLSSPPHFIAVPEILFNFRRSLLVSGNTATAFSLTAWPHPFPSPVTSPASMLFSEA